MTTKQLVRWLFSALALTLLAGCGTTKSGQCEAPQEQLEWWFIVDRGPTGSLTKCVYCDPTVEPSDVPDWIRTHAGEDYRDADDDALEGSLSCLYVYGPGEHDTEESCRVTACGESPTVNDPVRARHQAGRAITSAREGD